MNLPKVLVLLLIVKSCAINGILLHNQYSPLVSAVMSGLWTDGTTEEYANDFEVPVGI